MHYIDFERAVTDKVIDILNCSNGDAQGIVEANTLTVNEGWGLHLTPIATANLILDLQQPE